MKLGKIRLVRLGIESSAKGTPATSVTTECLCYDPEIKRDDNYIAREGAIGLAGRITGARGPQTGKCTIRKHLTSDGTDTLSDADLALFQACGMELDTGVLTPVTAIATQKTITVHTWRDGRKERLSGCMGTVSIEGAEVGKPVMATFELSGKYADLGDEDTPAASIDKTLPFKAGSCSFNIEGKGVGISRFTIAANNPVEMREDINAADGFAHFIVGAGRNWTWQIDPEVDAQATWDPVAISDAGTEGEASMVLTDGKVTVTIVAPACEILPPNMGVRGEKLIWDGLTLQCNVTTGDDEITLTMAAAGTVAATGTVTLGGQPDDANTVTISDGVSTEVFEFDDDASVEGTNTAVTIGVSSTATVLALIDAINASGLGITAATAVGPDEIDLTNDTLGTAGNVAITKTGTDVTVTGMSGGE